MNKQELMRRTGITTRQVDHWIRRGYLKPKGSGGMGNSWEWTGAEAEVVRRMVALVRAGFAPEVACRIARHKETTIELTPNIRVELFWNVT